jgi:hypothetical protein
LRKFSKLRLDFGGALLGLRETRHDAGRVPQHSRHRRRWDCDWFHQPGLLPRQVNDASPTQSVFHEPAQQHADDQEDDQPDQNQQHGYPAWRVCPNGRVRLGLRGRTIAGGLLPGYA